MWNRGYQRTGRHGVYFFCGGDEIVSTTRPSDNPYCSSWMHYVWDEVFGRMYACAGAFEGAGRGGAFQLQEKIRMSHRKASVQTH